MLLLLRRRPRSNPNPTSNLRRRPRSNPNPTSNLRRRHFSTCSDEAKLISTVFLLSPHRLTSLRHVITPSVALSSIRRLSNPSSALNLFNLLSGELHVPLSHAAYRHAIVLLLCSRRGTDALKLFDKMIERSRNPDSNSNSIDESFVDFLLISCVKAGDVSNCMQLVTRARELRCRIQTCTFNNLLNLLISRNRAQDAIFLFREHSSSKLFAPDTCSFNSIINGCCKLGDIDSAFRFFESMKIFGCVPNTITHNVLIAGLCKAEEVDRGWEVLRGLRFESPSLLNVKTYTSIISGYCKMAKMEEAEKVFDEMVECGIKPSRVTYNVLIHGYSKVGILELAVSVYERMKVCGCSPDVVTYTSLIHVYSRRGDIDEAVKLLNEMSTRQSKPNAYTYSILIDSLCKKNRLSEARYLLKEMNERKDILVGAFVYNPVIDGLCKAGDVEAANSILAKMGEKGCRPDKHTYTILIIGHCMKGRTVEAIGLFERMVATGCTPDSIIINNFVSLLLKAGMPSEAKRIMTMAPGKETKLDSSTLKEIPSLLTQSADVSVAL